jgi:hypothetical protein
LGTDRGYRLLTYRAAQDLYRRHPADRQRAGFPPPPQGRRLPPAPSAGQRSRTPKPLLIARLPQYAEAAVRNALGWVPLVVLCGRPHRLAGSTASTPESESERVRLRFQLRSRAPGGRRGVAINGPAGGCARTPRSSVAKAAGAAGHGTPTRRRALGQLSGRRRRRARALPVTRSPCVVGRPGRGELVRKGNTGRPSRW